MSNYYDIMKSKYLFHRQRAISIKCDYCKIMINAICKINFFTYKVFNTITGFITSIVK